MKRYFKFIALLLVLGFASCELERVSYSEISPDNFFRNESDIDKALTSLYYPFAGGWGKTYCFDQYSYLIISEVSAGLMTSKWVDQEYKKYDRHDWNADSDSWVGEMLKRGYQRYNHLTAIENVIHDIKASPVPDKLIEKSVAEANILYAWLAYQIYDWFGPVPLATEEARVDPETKILVPRLSDDEFIEIMIDKLDQAIGSDLLPIRSDEWGRVSKGLALMLKLKFLMIKKDYVSAEITARELYSYRGKPYELQAEYNTIFDKANNRNKEIIHAIPCGIVDEFTNYTRIQVLPWQWKGVDGTGSEDANGWQTFSLTWDFYDKVDIDDKRRETMIAEYVYDGVVNNRENNSDLAKSGPIPYKIGDDPAQVGSNGTGDITVFRFADVLLSLAECINNNDGDINEAVGYVNEIRQRAELRPLESDQYNNKDVFNKTILHERLVEFHTEGLARTDKIRLGTFVSDCIERNPDTHQTAMYKVRMPIPTKFINESEGVVKNNPNY